MATKVKGLELRGGIYYMRFQVKGNQVFESCRTGNLRDAEMILAKRKSDLVRDVVLDNKKAVNLHAAMDTYVATRVTPASKRNAASSMKVFRDALPNQPLKKLEKHAVDKVIQGLMKKFKPNTVQMRRNYFNAFANWCKKQNYMIFGTIESVKNAKSKIRWLTQDEQTKLLEVIHPSYPYPRKNIRKDAQKQDNWDFIVTLLDTGMRFGEAGSMQWHQVDLDKRVIYVKRLKEGRDTTLTITNRLHEVLTRRKDAKLHDTHVFESKLNNNCSTWMKSAVKRAGLSQVNGTVTVHCCRHTAAATWLQNGLSLGEVSHLLGHSSIVVTQVYAHFVKEDSSSKAADILNRLHAPVEPTPAPPQLKLVA